MKAIGLIVVVVFGLISTAYVAFQEGKEARNREVKIAEAHAKDWDEKIAAGWTPVMIEGAGRETLIPPPPPRPRPKTQLVLPQDDINNLIRQMQIVHKAIEDLEERAENQFVARYVLESWSNDPLRDADGKLIVMGSGNDRTLLSQNVLLDIGVPRGLWAK